RNADHALLGRVDVLAVDLEVLLGGLSRVARKRPLGDTLEHGAQLGVHVGEPGRVAVSVRVEMIKAGIFHLVVTMRVGKRIVSLPEVPFASEEGLVTSGLQNRSERPFRRWQAAAFALEGHGGHAAAIGNAASLHGRPTGRAAWLGIEGKEGHAFTREAIEAGRRHAAVFSAAIGTRVSIAEVIRYDEDDVRLLVLSLGFS